MRAFASVPVLVLFSLATAAEAAEDHAGLARYAVGTLGSAVMHFRTDVACHGGYLWRYKADMSEREGEGTATPTQIWVQPPGTPSVGLAMLQSHELTSLPLCLDGAVEAGRALAWGQLACGGWDYRVDFDDEASKRWYYRRDKEAGIEQKEGQRNQCTFDDNNTQHALRLLMAVDQALDPKDDEIHRATLYGLQCALDAQFDNGAWPQRWPLSESGYSRFYTFNDNSINDCITVMLEAYTTYNDERYLESAKKGGDFIILSQQPKPQAGWAQQYDEEMKPAWARWFEPPAVNGAVTPRNMTTLMTLYRATRDERYLEPFPAAIEWLEASRLENGKWARFYEPQTNKPLYVTNDKQVVYVYDDTIRPGYSWEAEYGIPRVIEQYEALRRDIEAGTVQWTIPPPAAPTRSAEAWRAEADRLAPQVREVCDALDAEGNWVRGNGWIYCQDFIRNIGLLSRYINAVNAMNEVP